jgi:hypothetical protein
VTFWLEGNFGGKKNSKIPLFFLQNSFNSKKPLVCRTQYKETDDPTHDSLPDRKEK